MSLNYQRIAWISGEVCEASGKYYSDTCGHENEKQFVLNDIFSRCPTCQQTVRWICFDSSVIEQIRAARSPSNRSSISFWHRPEKKP